MLRALVVAVVCCLCLPVKADQRLDIFIKGGRIVDGSGNPWYVGNIGIRNGKIVLIDRRIEAAAKRTINAKGLVIAPGFIDIHSHSDYKLFVDGRALSKIHQGVTTEVLGEGGSAGPFQGKLKPRVVETAKGDVQFTTIGGYFRAIENSRTSVNVCSYVGLSNIWRCVMGDAFDRPSIDQIEQMKKLVDQAMRDGALGLSSQLMMPPGSLARTDEVIQLARVAARHGGIYSSHIRNEGHGVFASIKEAIEIGRQAKIPVDIIHLKIAEQKLWGRMKEIVALIEAARREGIQVQANVYPYTRGNNNLRSIIPPWAHEGGRGKMLSRLKDPALRKRLKRDIRNGVPGWYNHFTAVGGDWGRMLVAGNNRFKGLTMDRVMSLRTRNKTNVDKLDELFEFLLEEGGSVSTVYAHHTEKDMNLALQQPWCSIGSDGSAYATSGKLRVGNPHPRNFGTFPRVLGRYVRQRKLLRLEDAIRKMTSLNAAKVGLRDRGLLVVGFAADVTVFDPKTIIDRAEYTNPFQYATGVKYVIVNGQLVLAQGKHTGAKPGRALRRQ